MNAYQELDEHLDALFRVMDLLVPNSNPGDIDNLEANIESIKAIYAKARELKIFSRLENLLFESGEEYSRKLVIRILRNFKDNLDEWKKYYNRKALLKAQHSVYLYKNVELKYLIRQTNLLIINTLSELKNFNDNYFNPKIQSPLLDILSESETSIKATIITETNESERVDDFAFVGKGELLHRFINHLLTIIFEFNEDCIGVSLESVISKYNYKEVEFPKLEDRIFLIFDKFEEMETQHLGTLRLLKEELAGEIINQSLEIRNLTINHLETITNNLQSSKNSLIESHLAFMSKKINSKELWGKLESIIQLPKNDTVIIAEQDFKYIIIGIIEREKIIEDLSLTIKNNISSSPNGINNLGNEKHDLSHKSLELYPFFIETTIDNLLNILKDYFQKEDYKTLKEKLINTKSQGEPIVFRSNGNRLAYAFKVLIELNYIVGCEKKDLQKWIKRNFQFTYRRQIHYFTDDYLEKCISRNGFPCKNPIIEVQNGKIVKPLDSYSKKINKY